MSDPSLPSWKLGDIASKTRIVICHALRFLKRRKEGLTTRKAHLKPRCPPSSCRPLSGGGREDDDPICNDGAIPLRERGEWVSNDIPSIHCSRIVSFQYSNAQRKGEKKWENTSIHRGSQIEPHRVGHMRRGGNCRVPGKSEDEMTTEETTTKSSSAPFFPRQY